MQWRRTPVDNRYQAAGLPRTLVSRTSGADLSVAGTALFGGFVSGSSTQSKVRQRSLEVVSVLR